MQTSRQVRVIKRGQRTNNDAATAATTAADRAAHNEATQERDVRAVVAGWVREHREGVGDYRHALTTLFARLDARTA